MRPPGHFISNPHLPILLGTFPQKASDFYSYKVNRGSAKTIFVSTQQRNSAADTKVVATRCRAVVSKLLYFKPQEFFENSPTLFKLWFKWNQNDMQTATRYRRQIQSDIFSHHSFLTTRKTTIAYFFGSWIRIQLEYTIPHTIICDFSQHLPDTRFHCFCSFLIADIGRRFLGLGRISWDPSGISDHQISASDRV